MPSPILHSTIGRMAVEPGQGQALHNEFVGSGPQPGIEIARSLGDISHSVLTRTGDSTSDELLFLDLWIDENGMEAFFADPSGQEAGDRLFASREESEWHRAPGGFDYHAPIPTGLETVYFTLYRAQVTDVADAVTGFAGAVSAHLPSARRHGQLSHALYVRDKGAIVNHPAANARRAGGRAVEFDVPDAEVLAVDSWPTLDGIAEHYRPFAQIQGVTAGELTVWRHADGFLEW